MATSRGRRSASGSDVTLMLTAGSLSRRLGDQRQRFGERKQRISVLHAERSDRGPPERVAVSVAQVRDQAPDVGARGTLDLKLGAVPPPPDLIESIHGHLALGNLDLLPPAGLSTSSTPGSGPSALTSASR